MLGWQPELRESHALGLLRFGEALRSLVQRPVQRMPLNPGASVAVIGAGAAGLVAVRIFRDAGFRVTAFECSETVGGTWNYQDVANEPDLARAASRRLESTTTTETPSSEVFRQVPEQTTRLAALPPVQSSIYAGLRTNLPRQVMQFSDAPFPEHLPSFIGHRDVQRYMVDYARRHNLERHIRFGVWVQRVQPVSNDVWSRYLVTFSSSKSPEACTQAFDAVCVCNGHYSVPQIPAEPYSEPADGTEYIPGLTDGTFCPGVVRHSHYYRDAEKYRDLRVICLGAGPSGVDISLEIAEYARKPVYLSCRAVKQMPSDSATEQYGVLQVPRLVAVIGPRTVQLADGSILHDIDVIMLCTGYRYSFPFLTEACGISVTLQGRVVTPLYRHLIPVSRWTLPLIGIPYAVVPFPLFEFQARYVAAVFQGRVQLPEMNAMQAAILEEKQVQQSFGLLAKHFHRLGDRQWAYNRELADAVGVKGPTLAVQSVYNDAGTHRKLDPKHYREREYRIFGDGPEDWEVQSPAMVQLDAKSSKKGKHPTRSKEAAIETSAEFSAGL